jgi:prepilin-type N-terminal cleavage/methylation domain-containing protein
VGKRILLAPGRRARAARGRRGFSLLELLIAVGVLLFGLLGFSQAVLRSATTNETAREGALAAEAARELLERLQSEDFSDLFRRYNGLPGDDPLGAGTAPGQNFAVAGLDPQEGDADGFVGRIEFPVNDAAPGVLREDLVLPALGMPRDLDGENGVDAGDHSDDYRLLPVIVRISWRGRATNSEAVFRTVLGNY